MVEGFQEPEDDDLQQRGGRSPQRAREVSNVAFNLRILIPPLNIFSQSF